MAHFHVATRRLTLFAQLDGAAGNLGGFIANALQVDHRLGNADDQTQVRGRWLAAGKNAQALFVDIAFHLVDLLVNLTHLLSQARVGLDQRGDRIIDLLLHQPAHRQEVAAHFLKLGIELRGDVVGKAFFANHVGVLGASGKVRRTAASVQSEPQLPSRSDR